MEPTSVKPSQLSCTNCRHRKVKCDKSAPCSACRRSNIECVFPTRSFKPRGRQGGSRARNVEITKRLNRLEGLMGRLGGEGAANALLEEDEARDGAPATRDLENSRHDRQLPNFQSPEPTSDGKLGTIFWTSLSGEFGGLRQLLDDLSDDDDELESHPSSSPAAAASSPFPDTNFVFGPAGHYKDLRPLHPSSPQIAMLIEIYFNNVDPLFKVFHKPTCQAALLAAADNLANGPIDSGLESLMFAMYLTAITSLTGEQCLQVLGQERDKLVAQYKYGTEAALANADFLSGTELATLQAFVIYLLCLRTHSENRSVWAMVALTVRLAHSFELNREAAVSAHSPFEAEMRRRLWHVINILDVRSSEDRGSPPMIVPSTFDTKMPCNANDADFGPLSHADIRDRVGCTEMTFNLIISEASRFARIWAMPDHLAPDDKDVHTSWYRTQAATDELKERLQSKYLMHCDPSIPLHWVCQTVGTLISKKLSLLQQYPLQGSRAVPESERDREACMLLAIELLESTEYVRSDPRSAQFGWFLKGYVQWHPLAVVLAELCVEPGGAQVERAWAAVDFVMTRLGDRIADNKRGSLWRPLKKMYAKAQAVKAHHQKLHPERFQEMEVPATSIGMDGIGSINLEDVPPAVPQNPPVIPTQDSRNHQDFVSAYGVLPNVDWSSPVDPMDVESWDEFLKSTTTWDNPSVLHGDGDFSWSMPFTMASAMP